MPKFQIDATHTKTYRHYVTADSLDEAKRLVLDNEHEHGDLIDEGEKNIDAAKEVEFFEYEK